MHITLKINISEEGLEQRKVNEIADALAYAADQFTRNGAIVGIPNAKTAIPWDYTIYRGGEIVGMLWVEEGSALK